MTADLTGAVQLPQPDPRGWLTFRGLPDDVRRAEDATQAADFEREKRWAWWLPGVWGVATADDAVDEYDAAADVLRRAGWDGRGRIRPATGTELVLLAHLGYSIPTDDVFTVVSFPSPGVRCRTWPQLTEAADG